MFAEPGRMVRMLGLAENAVVADLGAGTGFYAVAAAELLPRGKVYAVEVQKDYISKIRDKVRTAHLGNVEAIWGNIEKAGGTKIKDGAVDAVLSSNVLFQVEDKGGFLNEIKRILKPGGKVLLVDWTEHAHAISKVKAKEMFEARGFVLEREIEAGTHHYGMILRKQ